ncbi:hypothetical protein ADL27_42495, partial [Streptomyces sp. NRRL F-6602]
SGTALLRLADAYNDRDEQGRYGTQGHAQRAISCADDPGRPTPEEARKLLPEFRSISPVFGEFLAWDAAGWCHEWPVDGVAEPPGVAAKGASPRPWEVVARRPDSARGSGEAALRRGAAAEPRRRGGEGG